MVWKGEEEAGKLAASIASVVRGIRRCGLRSFYFTENAILCGHRRVRVIRVIVYAGYMRKNTVLLCDISDAAIMTTGRLKHSFTKHLTVHSTPCTYTSHNIPSSFYAVFDQKWKVTQSPPACIQHAGNIFNDCCARC